jgi:regulator of replication initiation timing
MTEHDEPNYVCADPRDAREAVLRKNIADCFREHSELTKENATLRAENAALRAELAQFKVTDKP